MSAKIKLVWIDRRLLHVIVALSQNQFIGADNVLIAGPDCVNDPSIADVMQLCLPKTMKVKIFSIEQLLEYINEGCNIRAMIIFPSLSIACDVVKAGFCTKEIQMPYPASHMMVKSLSDYFSEEDTEKIRRI